MGFFNPIFFVLYLEYGLAYPNERAKGVMVFGME